MKFKSILTHLSLLPLLIATSLAEPAEDNGFTPLYNGKDLSGWQTEGNWLPQDDGTLKIEPRKGEEGWRRFKDYLTTEKKYANFTIDLEYKLVKGGNSGIFFRIGDSADPVGTGIEAQILDSHGKADEKMTHHDCGGIIRTSPPSKNMSKPAGEWNRMIVTCKEHHLTVELNGEKIIDLELDKTDMKDRPLTGHIALQDHGQEGWFRNIKIKELP